MKIEGKRESDIKLENFLRILKRIKYLENISSNISDSQLRDDLEILSLETKEEIRSVYRENMKNNVKLSRVQKQLAILDGVFSAPLKDPEGIKPEQIDLDFN